MKLREILEKLYEASGFKHAGLRNEPTPQEKKKDIKKAEQEILKLLPSEEDIFRIMAQNFTYEDIRIYKINKLAKAISDKIKEKL